MFEEACEFAQPGELPQLLRSMKAAMTPTKNLIEQPKHVKIKEERDTDTDMVEPSTSGDV